MPSQIDPAGALFQQLRPRLTAISRRIVGSEAEAEDIVQDCFIKWMGADQVVLATPAAWLTTVVQHQSIDRLRRRVRDALAVHAAFDPVSDAVAEAPEDALLRRAGLGNALARMLACLSPAERLALVLHEVFECSHADIAAALGTRPPNARQYLSRARRRLREDRRETSPEEKLCRELVLRFQAAINGRDLPAMVSLLGNEQPVAVHEAAPPRLRTGACANDALYRAARAA
ncbi:sigma-70 family RNA polymerase sigma factor [Massilia phyllosphaerae]|uniref:sigma-70 family RNA polymerase sigma factor n=1 Tax=Massilia phyllosphaerae TaxID=3106034 RepID=UPI002B1CBBC0|nr:sigma-70 family RNA polymerase sigma factor [Massilia sp. SGZ-792]